MKTLAQIYNFICLHIDKSRFWKKAGYEYPYVLLEFQIKCHKKTAAS